MNNHDILEQSLHSLHVLVVDDDEIVLAYVVDLLLELGITHVQVAHNGFEALGIINNSASDPLQLLICDLSMPGMDGIEFFRHLAERNFGAGLILSSGYDVKLLKSVELLMKAHGLRFLGTLQKPANKEHLLSLLIKLLDLIPKHDSRSLIKLLSPEEVRVGLADGCLETFFQPKIRVSDMHVVGAECLVRWRHPERGILPPAAFVSTAEEYGLIDSLTMTVFRQAMKYLSQWEREGHCMRVAVNVSMDNLDRLSLPEDFERIALQARVDVEHVTLEITESRLVRNLAASLEVITRLRLKGFNLSIDDFGTGYSSMEKLNQMPFNELKIDRAFVCGAAADPAARAILELSVRMGKALGMNLVAEGVETQEDWDLVAAAGCDEIQGFFIAKPMPAQEFIPWKLRWEERFNQTYIKELAA